MKYHKKNVSLQKLSAMDGVIKSRAIVRRAIDKNIVNVSVRAFIKALEKYRMMPMLADVTHPDLFWMMGFKKKTLMKMKLSPYSDASFKTCRSINDICNVVAMNINPLDEEGISEDEFNQLTIESAVNIMVEKVLGYQRYDRLVKMKVAPDAIGSYAFNLACTLVYGRGFTDLTTEVWKRKTMNDGFIEQLKMDLKQHDSGTNLWHMLSSMDFPTPQTMAASSYSSASTSNDWWYDSLFGYGYHN